MERLFTRSIIILASLFVPILACSQSVEIELRDNTKVEGKVTAISLTDIFTTNGTYSYKQIAKLTFNDGSIEKKYIDAMTQAGVVVFSGITQVSILQRQETGDYSPVDLNIAEKLRNFEKQRTVGKAMQLIGVAITTASLVIQIEDPTESNVAIPLAGGGISLIGFIIDLDAGKHLKFNRPNRR